MSHILDILRESFPWAFRIDPAPAETDTVAAVSNLEIGKDIAGQLQGYDWADQKEIIELAMVYMAPWPCHIHRDPRKKAENNENENSRPGLRELPKAGRKDL